MANTHDISEATLKPRRLLRGSITYSAAKACETNILHELGYWDQETTYLTHLYRNSDLIKAIVVHHLGLDSADACHLADPEEWMHGSFNICIRVDIDYRGQSPGKQAIIRFPLPYRVGETTHPGNADEKILCEAGTYAWLQENCPNLPVPQLYGFGLSTGQTVCTLLWYIAKDLLLISPVHFSWQSAFCRALFSVSSSSTVNLAGLCSPFSLCSALQ
jgi:hypothetical protein